ncbi:CynX/NimT family MFS transporter [Vibrio neptunius]|uniref:MFS transporter n=1 Tax=Vibrio neptunius TaxID=170651 RepID=A0ABS3A4P1_9VIBR|nr:MFS transporter [Vibrio neptunius]MBN3494618.1 MFS transporter [Vibrio neptunius]MBN3517035.1 MFS transporter [Vibrio neptunius]MBN3551507.1 MFS transporter [Vibrio neptunius]MBN3579430.1 MFS transporter [Vibrio neptunius]MCH9873094.1 MFS transporter [Vibrio neptunius]
MSPSHSGPISQWGRGWLGLVLLWLAGAGTRLTILATPPVISDIHATLGLSETQVGMISGIPPVLFAAAAMLGALLITKTGAVKTVVVGLLITGLGSALRGGADSATFLYLATALTGLGVALMQPALPTIVAHWYPKHVVFATAIYVNGLLLGGEVFPVALTNTVLVPWLGSWREAYMAWGAVAWMIAFVFYLGAPDGNQAAQRNGKRNIWWPDFRRGEVWKLGLMMGCVCAIYFATNFFLPRYLDEIGLASQIASALIALNLGQIPASLLLLLAKPSVAHARWPYLVSALGLLAALLLLVILPSSAVIAASAVIGFFSAIVLILMLGLPSAVSPKEEVHRMSSLMLTVGYTCAVITPVVSGVWWDATQRPASAFLPMMMCCVLLFVCATRRVTSSSSYPSPEMAKGV